MKFRHRSLITCVLASLFILFINLVTFPSQAIAQTSQPTKAECDEILKNINELVTTVLIRAEQVADFVGRIEGRRAPFPGVAAELTEAERRERDRLNTDKIAALNSIRSLLAALAKCNCPCDCPSEKESINVGATPQNQEQAPKNEFALGFSTIREDSDPDRFNTYGFNAAYTRYLTERFGLTGEFGAHFRQRGALDISKYTYLGGITVLPFEGATTEDRATVFTHALFGAANNRFTFDNGVTRVSTSDTALAMALGGGVDLKVNKNVAVRLFQAEYAPTFFGNDQQHNFRLSTGLVLRFGDK